MSRSDLGAWFVDVRGRAVDLGFAAGWGAVKAVPGPVAARAFGYAGDIATRRDGRGVQQLRRNLRRVVGANAPDSELDRVLQEAMRSYARYWLETFRLPTMDVTRVAAIAERGTSGIENLDAGMAAGRGVIVALPHMGNWDAAAIWLIHHGGPFTTVVERLKPESLYRRFVAYREGLGMEVIPLTGGSAAPAGLLAERLTAGRCVCLVADRDISRGGVDVTFFGETARMPAGPALLAAQTGAALLPVSLWFMPDGWGQRIGPPVDLGGGRLRDTVRHGTQAIADWFAPEIAAHPSDWHMLQRLWVADLLERGTD
jgi:phosphatidylinositol dimannoside acyltransferase